jgi:DTW domain-containing protein YfiP
MFIRARKTKVPCAGCGLHASLCICALIPKLELQTRVTLIVHAKELKRTTNTGRLVVAALSNAEMRVRGLDRTRMDLSDLLQSGAVPLLFYPSEDASELTPELIAAFGRPIHLIVPDGNWRQAGKVHIRHPELSQVLRVKITQPNQAQYHLRNEHSEYGMSTLEAVARALAVIEGESVAAPLLELYQRKLEATLVGRGIKPSSALDVSGSGPSL